MQAEITRGDGAMLKKFSLALVFWSVCSIVAASSFAAPVPAWEFTAPGYSFSNGSWEFSTLFQVTVPVTVSALGYYDDPQNGFTFPNQVSLYTSAGTLLANATVDSKDQLIDHFRYAPIASMVLLPGIYEINGVSNSDNYTWNDPGFATADGIKDLGGGTLRGTSSSFVSASAMNEVQDRYWGPDLLVNETVATPAPESSTLLLVGIGLFCMSVYSKRYKGQVSRRIVLP